MDRRVSGGLILVMALLVALVVPKVLNPPVVDGVAAIAPPPPPPAVGDCVAEDAWSYGFTATGDLRSVQPITLVPCDAPHRNEIVHFEPVLAVSNDPRNSADGFDAFWTRCNNAAPDLRPTAAEITTGWQQSIGLTINIVGPSQRQLDGGQRWAACAVGIGDADLVQSLADLQGRDIPPEFGQCSLSSHVEDETSVSLPCTDPHNGEFYAAMNLPPGSAITKAELDGSCLQLVSKESRRPGLGSDDGLVVETRVTIWYDADDRPVTDVLPLPADAAGGWATCSLYAAGDRILTASLRQFGDGPLPWAS